MKYLVEELVALVAIGLFVAMILVWAAIFTGQHFDRASFEQRWEPVFQIKQGWLPCSGHPAAQINDALCI